MPPGKGDVLVQCMFSIIDTLHIRFYYNYARI